jgi:hypothetical protein
MTILLTIRDANEGFLSSKWFINHE